MHQLTPFLMFTGQAEEAISFYTALFKDSEVLELHRFGSDGPGAEGSVFKSRFRIGSQEIMAFDSPPVHEFGFTPSFSFFMDCESADEQDRAVEALSEGGKTLMPLGQYDFSRRYAWVQDRFGISWQLNLPYGPAILGSSA